MAIASLFGASPEQVLMARQKEAQEQQLLRNQQIAQQGQQFGVFAPLYQAGLKFGDIGTQAAMQRLFPQQTDPLLKKAVDIQGVLSQYADKDLTDPAVLKDISGKLREQGYVNESFQLSTQAFTMEKQMEELGIKRATAGREARKAERDELEFFKKNPEQTGPALQTLAAQLSQDPTNPALLKRYTEIAQAGTSGSMEAAAKEEKDKLDAEKTRTIIDKNKKELKDIGTNFDAGTRWNYERQAAINLLASNGYNPGDKLRGADLLNPELVQAQEKAMREPWAGSAMPSARSATTPRPLAFKPPAAGQSSGAVVDFDSLPK
jgi:hypothetical protein